MKTTLGERQTSRTFIHVFARALVVAGFLLGISARAQMPGNGPTNIVLESWSFYDITNWPDDDGYLPVSFTNIAPSPLGADSQALTLMVDTNVPAWLQYNVVENDGTTNLTVQQGSVTFWFAPSSWSSTNIGGAGPGEYGRLLEVGSYTPDSSYGLWSIYVDSGGNNLYFSAQTNDLSSNLTTYVSAPISWTTNYFHFVALTYCATNTTLYLDGTNAASGPGLTVYPGSDVLSNGFCIGSDTNGIYQAHGLFDLVATYNYPMNSNDVWLNYQSQMGAFVINPNNLVMEAAFASAFSTPSTAPVVPDVITGSGNLTWVGTATPVYSTNAYYIWITNVTTTAAGGGTYNITFTIQGGQPGYYYDVFANPYLSFGTNGNPWAWMGQGTNSGIYTLNIPSPVAYLILGTPLDTDGNGLTDAYELLVSKTNPYVDDQNGAGIPDGWQVLLGLNPLVNQFAQPGTRSNYGYTTADWLNGVSGVKTGSVSLDNEGNVLSVSQ